MTSFNIKALTLALSLSLAPLAIADTTTSSSVVASQEMHPERPRPRQPRYSFWECASRNLRGQHFVARDRIRQWAEQRAQNKCLRQSLTCRSIGCRPF